MNKLKELSECKQIYFGKLRMCQNQSPEILKQIRGQHGWSQATLADKLGYTASYVSHIESGKMIASSKLLIKLAEIGNENY